MTFANECARCGGDEEGRHPLGWTSAMLSVFASSEKSGSLCRKNGIIVELVCRVLDFSPTQKAMSNV